MDWFWKERRRRRKALRALSLSPKDDSLREFVYLDEVSVTSLVSSILGKVPSEFTDTTNVASKSQRNVGFDAGVGPVKTKVGFANESARTEDAKVQSKATIQVLFRRLHREVSAGLTIRPVTGSPPLSGSEIDSVLRGESDEAGRTWLHHQKDLRRGSIAELEVELYPDSVFRISAILTTFTELISEGKEQFGGIDQQEFDNMVAFNAILEKLLAGLIPLKCRIVDYCVIDTPDGRALVHRSLLGSLPPQLHQSARDAFLVGVVDRSSFWKDIRRILFTRARFRVLCRLSNNGIGQEWEPVKLVHLLGEVSPQMGEMVKLFSVGALQSFSLTPESAAPAAKTVAAYMRYGMLVADRSSTKLDDHDVLRIAEIAASAPPATTIDHMRAAFTSVAEVIQEKKGVKLEATQLSQMRMEVLEAAGLLPGDAASNSPVPAAPPQSVTAGESYVDAEFIAIYW